MIDIKADIRAAEKALGALKKQVPFAAAYAMTQTGKKIKQVELAVMQQSFKTVNRHTRGALYLKSAQKRDFESGRMRATVWLIGATGRRNRHYLYPNIHGGQRSHTGFERRLIDAGVMSRDEYAIKGKHVNKITKGMYQKMLAQLKAYNDRYQHATNSTRSVRNRRGQRFYVRRDVKPAGIWMKQGKRNVPVFIFARFARYSRRFDFFGVARKTANKYWPGAFERAIQYAIKTAR